MGAEPFRYRRCGRSGGTLFAVAAVWFVLVGLVMVVEASPWLMGTIGLFTIPAVLDLWRNPQSGLDITHDGLAWFTGRHAGEIGWPEIDRIRLDTRLDFSVRASAVLRSGRKVRLPYQCTPPHRALEAALEERGIRTERHHFSLIG